ncbi:MAG: MerR family transcriptional regulator, partial [Acidobacteria bacterium]|nr:MerR family transcriptional regulator [Acidobacteriota bacterium]
MRQPLPEDIPDKLFFKIGEVCELVGVQAHVLRYWETEFPMLQPDEEYMLAKRWKEHGDAKAAQKLITSH